VVEGCACFRLVGMFVNHVDSGPGDYSCAYCSVDMSAPANAKSQSCFLQCCGEVRPWSTPQFVRYSTQLGPPSAVAV
jgi:hypothetical protein